MAKGHIPRKDWLGEPPEPQYDGAGSAAAAASASDPAGTAAAAVAAFADEPVFTGPARLMGYVVAELPAGTEGDTAYVTDALAPTFGAAVVGGGAVKVPVFYDGAAWIVG